MTDPGHRPALAHVTSIQPTRIAALPWRTGGRNPYTIYAQTGPQPADADPFIGSLNTPEASAEAVGAHNAMLATLARLAHDPAGDCTCEPGGPARCEYRRLADTVDAAFSPPDQDAAEVAIHIEAVKRAAAYIASQPCACTPAAITDQMPCPRCAALGRLNDEVQPR